MAFQYPDSGPYNLAEYLVAPLPWLTASTVSPGGTNRHDFPNVTQYLTVKNTGLTGTLYVGFTSAGVGGSNRLSLVPSASVTCDYRVTSLYIKGVGSCDYEVIAGLTGIKVRDLPPLSSSLPGVADADVVASIPNMSAWWDAADPTTLFQDSSFTTPATAMSQPIGGWLDKSGNGKHLTQSTAGLRPTYFLDPYYPPSVLCSAVDRSWMSSQGSIAIGGGAYTVFAVAKYQYMLENAAQCLFRFSDFQNNTNAFDMLAYFVVGNGQLTVGNSAANVFTFSNTTNNKIASNKTFLTTVRSESGTFPTLRTNSVAIVSGTSSVYLAPTSKPFWINSSYLGATTNVQYHEFLVFNRRLSDAEMGTVESYLMGKWVNWATPLRIPSCSAWYDSYPGFGMHTSSTLLTSSKNPGDPVYDWIDGAGYVAGTHNRFLQTTTTLQPVITTSGSGGRRMLASDGVDDTMAGPTLASMSPSNDFTFAFAIDPPTLIGSIADVPTAYGNYFYITENNSNFGFYTSATPAPRLQFNVYTSVGATIGLTASVNTPYVVTCRYVSSSRMMYMSLNGLGETTLQNGGIGNIAARNALFLFGKAAVKFLQCRMGEVIAYDRSLTSAELALLVSYMKGKWGISLSMVLGMPHFQSPPPGQNSVAEYMASTTPFLTASVLLPGVLQEITFPYVTAWVAVRNVASSGSLQLGFTAQGTTGSSYLALSQSTAITCSYRLSSIFLYAPSVASSYEVIAGLTGIPIRNLTSLSSLTGTIGAV